MRHLLKNDLETGKERALGAGLRAIKMGPAGVEPATNQVE